MKKKVLCLFFSTMFMLQSTGIYATSSYGVSFSERFNGGYSASGSSTLLLSGVYVAKSETSCSYGSSTGTKCTFTYWNRMENPETTSTKTAIAFGQYGSTAQVLSPRYDYTNIPGLTNNDVFTSLNVLGEHSFRVLTTDYVRFTENH